MKGLFKHFVLIALLVFHASWGSVMASQMQKSHFTMDTPDSSMLSPQKVATIDQSVSKPCPHHSNNIEATSPQAIHSMVNCNEHDCSNCNCVNVVSSIPTLTASVDYIQVDRSNVVTFIASIFPDSPPSFILRPPIS